MPVVSDLSPARYEDGTPLTILGLREHYTADTASDIPGLWTRLQPDFDRIPGKVNDLAYGIVFSMEDGVPGFDYFAGAEVSLDASGAGEAPDGSEQSPAATEWQTAAIPAQKYAVFVHPGHVSTIRETIGSIWESWRVVGGHKLAGEIDMVERYGEDFDPKTGYGTIEVWVPISE